jgi:hypothetical protein
METTRWVAEGAGERRPKSPAIMTTGHPVPCIRPPWKRTSRRSSDGRERSCSRVRRPSRSATGLPARRQRSRPHAPRRLVQRLGHRECRRIRPFDPFPFPFLTMTVSLEAIFLALFVLASQNRLTRQADKQSSRPADRFACRARDDDGAAVAPRHRPSPRGANQRDVRAVARLDEKDRPSTTHESVGGARGARHLSYTREVRGQSEGFESGILSACLQRN